MEKIMKFISILMMIFIPLIIINLDRCIHTDNYDPDNDGILSDGDQSGKIGDNPCIGGNTINCDDNCPSNSNPLQEDCDMDGIGDVCDSKNDCGILINEIMFDTNMVADDYGEYFELYNSGNIEIDITNWSINDAGGNPIKIYKGGEKVVVSPHSYFLLARNNNVNTNGGLPIVDFLFSFSLNNTGDTITLKDSAGNLIDEVTYFVGSNNWPKCGAGKSLERIKSNPSLSNDPTNWQCAISTYGAGDKGTPRSKNTIIQNDNPYFKFYYNTPELNNPNGLDTAFINLIDSAKTQISAHFYNCDLTSVRDALIKAKIERKVSVRFITDWTYYNDETSYKNCYKGLEAVGINVITENFPTNGGNTSANSHNKFAVVDNSYVWTGSWNAADYDTNTSSNDALLIQSSTIAQAYLAEFNEMWGSSGETPDPNKSLFGSKKAKSSPTEHVVNNELVKVCFEPSDDCENVMLDEIKNANYTIDFAIFVFTEDIIADAIIERAKAGVKVRGLFDSRNTNQSGSEYSKMYGIPNIEVKKQTEVEPHAGCIHHKFMIIDGETTSDPVVITGSRNWSVNSETINDENIVSIHSSSLAKKYTIRFKEMFYGNTN